MSDAAQHSRHPKLTGAGGGAKHRARRTHHKAEHFPRIVLPLLIAALWLSTHPYLGIFHDARFYAADAIGQLQPGRFANDLFFHYGAQGEFSAFPGMYAAAIAHLGLGPATLVLTAIGQTLWLGALLYLAAGLGWNRRCTWLSVALVVALPSKYGSFVGYGEPFLTPRQFAESMTMLALGLLLRGRGAWALLPVAGAVIIHPLMALPGLAFCSIYLALRTPLWWLLIAAGALIALGFAAAGVPPFANLLVTYDPEWFEIVRIRDSMCFFLQWSAVDYCQALGAVVLAGMALAGAGPDHRRFLSTALAVGIGGIGCVLIGGDVAHNVFFVEIQPWRSMWLLVLIAHLYVAPIFFRLLQAGERLDLARVAFVGAVVALLLSRLAPSTVLVAAPALLLAAALVGVQMHLKRQLPQPVRLVLLVLLGIACAAAIVLAYETLVFLSPLPDEVSQRLYRLALLVLALGLAAAVMAGTEQRPPWVRRCLFAANALLLLLAIIGWDARTAWARFQESEEAPPPALAPLMESNATVYWEGGVEVLWFRFRHSSYFSCSQGTGALFFRGTAIEYQRRVESFWPLRTLDFGQSLLCPPLDQSDKRARTRDDLAAVCRREPKLDYLVLTEPVEGLQAKTWISDAVFRDVRTVDAKLSVFETNRFYIYSCSSVRSPHGRRDAGGPGLSEAQPFRQLPQP